MLQFITNTDSPVSVVDQALGVIDGGCKWIQVRMKDASDDEIAEVVNKIKPICIEKEVFLILDDRVELAKTLDVGGVHLGKMDMVPSKARTILGPAAVIGVTANTIEDVIAVRSLDIDYIGMGPFTHTNTKKNLAPILGLNGIQNLCRQMEENELRFPTVAVGGIQLQDVEPLLKAGVKGLAVSGAIAFAKDIKKATQEFISAISRVEI